MSDAYTKMTAAESIAQTAKDLVTPFSTEQSNLAVLRMGAQMALHELQMEIIGSGKRSMSTLALSKRLRKLSKALDALKAEGR